jgi:hypothetical protein
MRSTVRPSTLRKAAVLAQGATLAAMLTACNSGSLGEGLRLNATEQQQQGGRPAAQTQQLASLGNIPPVSFLPVSGAPQSAVASLAGALRNAAQTNAVPVVLSTQQGATYQLKGYFSAAADGKGAAVVYVWDVLDASGRRVHRISGKEPAGPAGGDPWSGVTPDVLARIANATMTNFRGWAASRAAG